MVGIGQQRFQRSEAQNLMDDLVDQFLAFGSGDQFALMATQLFGPATQLRSQADIIHFLDGRQVHVGQQLRVDVLS